MKEPLVSDFGITHDDVIWANKLDFRMPVAIAGASAVAWLSVLGLKTYSSGWAFFIAACTLGTLFLAALTTVGGALLMFSVMQLNARYRGVEKYKEAYKEYTQNQKRTLVKYWRSLSGIAFEHELAKLYQKLGYGVRLTPATGDGGVDIWLESQGEKIAVQCKAHAKPIGPGALRELAGSMQHFGVKNGVVASVSGFTDGALKYAKENAITLVDIDQIIFMNLRATENVASLTTTLPGITGIANS